MIARLLPIIVLLVTACGGMEETHTFNPPQDYEARSGEKIYLKHCKLCHGKKGDKGAAGATNLTKSRLDSAAIVSILENGRNSMSRQIQHFKSEKEIENIVEHVKSLRK